MPYHLHTFTDGLWTDVCGERMDSGRFRVGDRVVVGGCTVHKGETGQVRGVRRAGGEEYQYFVFYDQKWWPLEPTNGMWVNEAVLSHLVPDLASLLATA